MENHDPHVVVAIVGPTASGKTPLALHLAAQLNAEIVNYDSVQVYRDFDIGSAKPSADELARVRHHLIGEFDPSQPINAGEYARRARVRVREIIDRGRAVVLVGGTGFYLRALLDGLSPGPASTPTLRRRLQEKGARHGSAYLHRLLARLDPESAARITLRDLSKIIRALEVRVLTGKSMSSLWHEAPPQPFAGVRTRKIGLNPPRPDLYARIERRAQRMFDGAIQEETRRLLQRYPADTRLFQAHGYKQACDIVLRHAALGPALAEAQQEQRNYAKRQWTWFRRDSDVHWIDGFGEDAAVQSEAVRWLGCG